MTITASRGTLYATTGNTTTHVITVPTHTSGDLLIAVVCRDGGGTTSFPSSPTVWNEIADVSQGGTCNLSVGYTFGNGSDTSVTISTSSEQAWGAVWRFVGAHASTPPEIATAGHASSSTSDPPSLTPTWGSADTLWFAVVSINGGFSPGENTGFPYTQGQEDGGTGGSGGAGGAWCYDVITAATEDPGVFTHTAWANQGVTGTIGVRPAATGSLMPDLRRTRTNILLRR